MQPSQKQQILAILAAAHDVALGTAAKDGAPHVTVVSFASRGLRLFFGCSPRSRKAQNLAAGARIAGAITLPYESWGQIRGLSFTGRARRLENMGEIEAAGSLFAARFPEMTLHEATAVAQDIRLYEVTPEEVAILDYVKGFGHTEHCAIAEGDLAIA